MIFHCFSLLPAIFSSRHADRSSHTFACYGNAVWDESSSSQNTPLASS